MIPLKQPSWIAKAKERIAREKEEKKGRSVRLHVTNRGKGRG